MQVQTILDSNYIELKKYFEALRESMNWGCIEIHEFMKEGNKIEFSIKNITQLPNIIDDIINLYEKHKSMLGFFPKGAFLPYSRRGEILVAIAEKEHS